MTRWATPPLLDIASFQPLLFDPAQAVIKLRGENGVVAQSTQSRDVRVHQLIPNMVIVDGRYLAFGAIGAGSLDPFKWISPQPSGFA